VAIHDLDWITETDESPWLVIDQCLSCQPQSGHEAVLTKGPLLDSYEMVVSAKLDGDSATGYYGFFPAVGESGLGRAVRIRLRASRWELECGEPGNAAVFCLAEDFDPWGYQQFRMRKERGVLTIQHEAVTIGEIVAPECKTRVGLCVGGVPASFDSARVTAIEL